MIISCFDNHPLVRSVWMWPGGMWYLTNCHAQFRHDFTISTLPETAPFYISADQNYRLYINGQYVCRGPRRGFQNQWPFDEVDVLPFLRQGHNIIAIEAYNPGCGSFKYIHADSAGVICAAEWPGCPPIHSDREHWRMRRSPAHRLLTGRLAFQMEYQEDFDAAKDDFSWISSEIPPEWPDCNPQYRFRCFQNFGEGPWFCMESRGLPMLRETCLVPEKITAHAVGRQTEGWQDCENISWHWVENEHPTITDWSNGADIVTTRNSQGLHFLAQPTSSEQFRCVTFTLGEIHPGSLELILDKCTGDEIVDAHYHQSVPDGIPREIHPAGCAEIALATRLHAAQGHCSRLFYPILGAREITLVFRNVTHPLDVTVRWRLAEYPFTLGGTFSTSDSQLNAIWELCRKTQQCCALDAYIDTPWREQGLWWADAVIQARNTYFIDGEPRLLERGIDTMALQPSPNALTPAVAPCARQCIIPDFSLIWCTAIYDDFFQTGDLTLFHRHQARIQAIFNYFDSVSRQGLVHHDPRFWFFQAGAGLPTEGFPAFMNFWYLFALQIYRKLLLADGQSTQALDAKIQGKKDLLHQRYFLQDKQLYCAGLNDDLQEIGTPSVHDQILAILCGVAPQEAIPTMMGTRILPYLRGESCDFPVPSAYWSHFALLLAEELGLQSEAIAFIRRNWLPMLPTGGCWEVFNWTYTSGASCCHAWSAHPLFHIPQLLLGLKQLEPAWKQFSVAPTWSLLPEYGVIHLPFQKTPIEFRWNKDDFTISSDSRQLAQLQRNQGQTVVITL